MADCSGSPHSPYRFILRLSSTAPFIDYGGSLMMSDSRRAVFSLLEAQGMMASSVETQGVINSNVISNPWETLAGIVMKHDKKKVKNALKDLDSLQKLAGLFSVVFAGFIIESSRRLTPDPSHSVSETARSLYTVELAIYRLMESQTMDHVMPLPPVPDAATSRRFQPSARDIHASALWYSALILSIATASFSLVVKQWLRYYLAHENLSPLPYLRIRHIRYPELARWRVFSVAETLPLVQQIAFALFFGGLCFPKGSIIVDVEDISYILIIGWAFCICTSTLLPMFFPRCPYKTPLLNPLLYSVHIGAIRLFRSILAKLVDWQSTAYYDSIRDRALRWTLPWFLILDNHLRDTESNTMLAERADLDILVEIDRQHLNDTLLETTIHACLRDLQPEWEDVVAFVLRILQHRMPLTVPMQDNRLVWQALKPAPLDLRTLTRAGYTAVVAMVAQSAATSIMSNARSNPSRTLEGWQRSKETIAGLYILFSPTRWSLPPSAIKVLSNIVRYQGTDLIRILAHECPCSTDATKDLFNLLISGLSQVIDQLDLDAGFEIRCFETLLGSRFGGTHLEQKPNANASRVEFSILSGFETLPWTQVMSPNARTDAARFIIQTASRAVQKAREPEDLSIAPTTLTQSAQPLGVLVDAIIGMWSMACIAKIEQYSHTQELKFRSVISGCLATPETTSALLKALGQTKAKFVIHAQTKWTTPPFGPWLLIEDTEEKMKNLEDALTELSTASPDESNSCSRAVGSAILICYVVLSILEPPAASCSDTWKIIFDILTRLGTQSLETLSGSIEPPTLKETLEVARRCLELLHGQRYSSPQPGDNGNVSYDGKDGNMRMSDGLVNMFEKVINLAEERVV